MQFQANMQTPFSSFRWLTQLRGWIWRLVPNLFSSACATCELNGSAVTDWIAAAAATETRRTATKGCLTSFILEMTAMEEEDDDDLVLIFLSSSSSSSPH
jgi:hypothetical protein